jgi:hypothetical protein
MGSVAHMEDVSKVKSCSSTRHGGFFLGGGGGSYSSYSLLKSALDGGGGQHHAPAALYPRGKSPRYPLYSGLGGPQSRSGGRG